MRKTLLPICLLACCLACCFTWHPVYGGVPTAPSRNQRQDAPQKDLPPSPLEASAARPTAKIVWFKLIGFLESREARATVTALVVEDSEATPGLKRGLRIDLAHLVANPDCNLPYVAWRIMCERANAAVFVEEERLEAVRDGIKRGAAQLRPMEFISRYYSGSPGHAATGLIVCGYQLSDRQPEELAALFTETIVAFRTAPR